MPRWSYDTMAELNPQVKEQTNILVVSPPLAKGGVFIVKGIPPDKQEFMMATRKVWKSPRTKQLMTLFHTQEVVLFKPADMQSMTKLYEEYMRLTKRR